jgi:hypothetical protein
MIPTFYISVFILLASTNYLFHISIGYRIWLLTYDDVTFIDWLRRSMYSSTSDVSGVEATSAGTKTHQYSLSSPALRIPITYRRQAWSTCLIAVIRHTAFLPVVFILLFCRYLITCSHVSFVSLSVWYVLSGSDHDRWQFSQYSYWLRTGWPKFVFRIITSVPSPPYLVKVKQSHNTPVEAQGREEV